ncbi:MAG: uL15 family ribosomal protein, partial [Candidatus Diapherotrites archaeon]|nr:uL15 family ribosomal protein [Candidatus Diapherotrites archaeon]
KKILKKSIALDKHAKKTGHAIWKDLAAKTKKYKNHSCVVNLSKLERLAKKSGKKSFFVLGKVLGSGEIFSGLDVAAIEFSKSAREKILHAKGNAMSIEAFVGKSPQKSEVVIVK